MYFSNSKCSKFLECSAWQKYNCRDVRVAKKIIYVLELKAVMADMATDCEYYHRQIFKDGKYIHNSYCRSQMTTESVYF